MQPSGEGNAEASPLWGLVLLLAEIAERVERRRVEEHEPTLPKEDPASAPAALNDPEVAA